MSDLRDKIADLIRKHGMDTGIAVLETTDAILALIRENVPPLEWRRIGDRLHWTCENTLSGKDAFIKVYAGTEVFDLYADGFRGVGNQFGSFEAATEAANERHVNAVLRAAGLSHE